MAIDFKPFEELFAPEYQLTYISTDGHIDVGPNTYSVFHYYTMQERQVIFQVCEKHLPWEHTQEQEQWERTMYMYQFIIKSPPPFPYSEYPLSEDIIMAITWTSKISNANSDTFRADISFQRFDDETGDSFLISYSKTVIETTAQRLALLDTVWAEWLDRKDKQTAIGAFITNLEQLAKETLEARET